MQFIVINIRTLMRTTYVYNNCGAEKNLKEKIYSSYCVSYKRISYSSVLHQIFTYIQSQSARTIHILVTIDTYKGVSAFIKGTL
jgi:hypothetical protein